MALRPTIFKCELSLSDLDRQYYDTLQLTVARHPSETDERMMARILVYCIHADERLEFSRGLSATDEPDIWLHTLDGQILSWIDVGEPSGDRMRKASRLAQQVYVYSFNTKSALWWEQVKGKCEALPISVFQFEWREIEKLATFTQRKIELSVTISGASAFIAGEHDTCEVHWNQLSASN